MVKDNGFSGDALNRGSILYEAMFFFDKIKSILLQLKELETAYECLSFCTCIYTCR